MRTKMNSLKFLLLIIFFISSCASYRYGNETYHSKDALLRGQQEILSTSLASITQTGTPVHGRLLLSLPTPDEMEKHFIKGSSRTDKEKIDLFKTVMENDTKFHIDVITKRKIFDEVKVLRDSIGAPHINWQDYDYLLYQDVDGLFLESRNARLPHRLTMDKSQKSRQQRTLLFLEDLERMARDLSKVKGKE